jgi:proline dehydrogenase
LFAYSVEVDEAEATSSSTKLKENPPHKRIVDEMIRCIDVAADFEDSIAGKVHGGRRTWVAVKITALLPDAHALIRLSEHVLGTRPRLHLPIAFPGCPHPSDLDILDGAPTGTIGPQDIEAVRELYEDLVRICTRAQERGVKIIIDAEYRLVVGLLCVLGVKAYW